ncbi:MAG TPA: transcriptional repressor LexA [Burkholderiales bacterium]|jgi:repressor LexA|nr:transcriptional repressor LexA [Burkholderiales bacterium]
MSIKLTARQAEILEFIRDAVKQTSLPPTRAEICTTFGFKSPNAAEEHLRALARKGAIELSSGTARGIQLAEQAAGTLVSIIALPVIGRVAAGSPILAEQNVDRNVPVDPAMFNPKADYLLKVKGLSMRDVGILDGDLLAVHSQSEARNGQIVVARLDNEVTVKRFFKKGSTVELVAENPDFEPIIVDLRRDPLAIEGLAVGIIRAGL